MKIPGVTTVGTAVGGVDVHIIIIIIKIIQVSSSAWQRRGSVHMDVHIEAEL